MEQRNSDGFSSGDKSQLELEANGEDENDQDGEGRESNGDKIPLELRNLASEQEEAEPTIRETEDGNRKKSGREVKEKFVEVLPKGLSLYTLAASKGETKKSACNTGTIEDAKKDNFVVENVIANSKTTQKLKECKDMFENTDTTADDFKRSLKEALSMSKISSVNKSNFVDELKDMPEMKLTATEIAGNEDEVKQTENSSLSSSIPDPVGVPEKESCDKPEQLKCSSNPDHMDVSEKENSDKLSKPGQMDVSDSGDKLEHIKSPSNTDQMDDNVKETSDKLEEIKPTSNRGQLDLPEKQTSDTLEQIKENFDKLEQIKCPSCQQQFTGMRLRVVHLLRTHLGKMHFHRCFLFHRMFINLFTLAKQTSDGADTSTFHKQAVQALQGTDKYSIQNILNFFSSV